ncbi:MAG: 3-ketoacyl-CoA thiolase, partial [Coriobacteriia bacterium]
MTAYVLGVGKTRFGPSSHPMPRLAHEAILGALTDADMSINDIGAVIVANFLGGPNESQLHLGSVV